MLKGEKGVHLFYDPAWVVIDLINPHLVFMEVLAKKEPRATLGLKLSVKSTSGHLYLYNIKNANLS